MLRLLDRGGYIYEMNYLGVTATAGQPETAHHPTVT